MPHLWRAAWRRTALALVLLLALAACGAPSAAPSPQPAAEAQPATLRLGYFPNLTHAVALVGVGRGTFQEAIGGTTLETKTFNAGPALIEALFANEIDIAYIGPNPAINGYVKSDSAALRIIAGATSGGAMLVVRPDAGIAGVADLSGKKLATPQLGNTQDVALRHYLQQNGLETADKGGTVTIVPTQNPDILTLFTQGQIDGAWVPEPWAARLILEANGTILVDERDLWPDAKFVTTHVIVSTTFLANHPGLVKAFLRAHIATVDSINAEPEASKQLVNAEIERITTRGLPAEVLDTAWQTVEFTYDPLPPTLFVSADHAFALGFLGDTKPDLSKIYDLALLNELLRESGRTPVDLP